MAITLGTAARNAACNATVDLVDAGSGAGKLKIKDGGSVLATVTLDDPAFGNAATGVATAEGLPLAFTGSASGEADGYDVTDSDDNVIWSGVVTGTGGGGDLELDNVNIANGQDGEITAWTHTHPA